MSLRAALIALIGMLTLVASPAIAQMTPPPPPPQGGWLTNGDDTYFGTPDAACRRQHELWNGSAIYDPPTPWGPYAYNCHWHRPTGQGQGILPTYVDFWCQAGSSANPNYTCSWPKDPPECPTCSASDPKSGGPPSDVGDPISLATGSQWHQVTDYSTADGLLAVKRYYRSIQGGARHSADHALPGFGYAWHGVVPGRIVISGDYEESAQFFDEQGKVVFFLASTSNLSSYDYVSQGIERARLSLVGTPTTDRIDYFKDSASVANGAGEMRLDFANGEYILFRRSDVFRYDTKVRYLVPVEHGFASGYKQSFDYPDTGEYPSRIYDSFDREIAIDWDDVNSPYLNFEYKVIAGLDLPDGTSLAYEYDRTQGLLPGGSAGVSIGGSSGGSGSAVSYYADSPQDRLREAKHLTAASATLWHHSYLYENPFFQFGLTGVKDQLGRRLSTISYTIALLTGSAERAGGFDKYSVSYLQNQPSDPLQDYWRVVTGPLGQEETYKFFRDDDAVVGMRLVLKEIERSASPTVAASSETFEYADTNGYDLMLSSVENHRGNTATMTIDTTNRRPTVVIEANGTSDERSTNITWHSTFDLPTHEERQGLDVDYTYSASGQLLTRTETDTTSHTVPYSTAAQARTVTYTWDSNGRLLTVNGPLAPDSSSRDDTLTYAYDGDGNLTSVTDGFSHVTQFGSHDANGRPGTMTDMNGVVTEFTYDGRGRVETIKVKHPSNSSLDALTTVEYDVEGRITGITRPATEKIIFDYNLAGLMTSMRAADGERIDYTYDPMGNVTQEAVKRSNSTVSRSTIRTFDSLGRMLSEALGPRRIRRWAYDPNGNATTLTNPNSNATTQSFDALDRLVTTVAPDSGTTALVYDEKDGVTENTDPKSVTTEFVRNGFGEVIQEISPDRGNSIYWYDAAGNMMKSQDGRGQIVDYSYDILSRLTEKEPQGLSGEAISYSWDSGGLSGSFDVGRLGAITDASGTTQFSYDHRGNMLIQQQAIGGSSAAQLVYSYDLGDHISQITYPSGRIVQYGHDTKGRVNLVQTKASSSVTPWTEIADTFTYEPFAALKSVELGNGLSVANDWGADGRLASRRLYRTSGGMNLSWLGYTYDANDNITKIEDKLDEANSIFYGYDNVDRLASTMLTASSPTSSSETYSYTSGTNRMSSLVTGAGTRTITYDGRGNTASESRPGSISATTAYDGFGRLIAYSRTDVGSLTFAYNGRDDRVSQTNGGGTRRFVYDPDGWVLGEYGASASDVKAEYIWALPDIANDNGFGGDDGVSGYMPMAVATPDSGGTVVLNWVHGNHLGVPLVTTDDSGVLATTPNDYLAPGFPGQSRTVADLFYNRYRDFDPTIGRYIQADPIGLAGGQNSYAYAANNPINLIDPEGKNALAIPIAICLRFPAACAGVGGAVACILTGCNNPPKPTPAPPPSESRGKSDPGTLPDDNPGRDCDGKCNPCPKGKKWWVNRPGHGHKNGYWHTIVYNQNPKTCMCYADRPSRGLEGK